jgi:hypothetical protein
MNKVGLSFHGLPRREWRVNNRKVLSKTIYVLKIGYRKKDTPGRYEPYKNQIHFKNFIELLVSKIYLM